MGASLPGLCTLEEGLKIAEWSSPLCFLLRPPGGAGSAARTPARLLEQFSPVGGSDLLGHREGSREDDSSTGELLQMLKSDSWKHRRKQDERRSDWFYFTRLKHGEQPFKPQKHKTRFAQNTKSDLVTAEVDFLSVKQGHSLWCQSRLLTLLLHKPVRRIQASEWGASGTWARQQVWWGGWSALPAEGAAASAVLHSQRRRRRARLKSEGEKSTGLKASKIIGWL